MGGWGRGRRGDRAPSESGGSLRSTPATPQVQLRKSENRFIEPTWFLAETVASHNGEADPESGSPSWAVRSAELGPTARCTVPQRPDTN